MKTVIALVLLVFAVTETATADDSLLTKKFANCMDKSEGVTSSMLDCIGTETTTQDGRLNGAYKKLATQLTPNRKKHLLAAQRLWIQYRDANCKFYADPDGGTMATVNASDCVLQATAARAKELENFLE
jgi:uncharacterized protein YecT (DUF1311 family)